MLLRKSDFNSDASALNHGAAAVDPIPTRILNRSLGEAATQSEFGSKGEASSTPVSFWNSLRYLSVTRLMIAGILLLVLPVYYRRFETGALQDLNVFLSIAAIYAVVAIVLLLLIGRLPLSFQFQMRGQVAIDLCFLGLLVASAGGPRSGFGLLFLVPVAGAAILSSQRAALFTAAVSSCLLLAQSVWLLLESASEPGLISAASTCTMLFAVAFVVNRLAERAKEQEARAIRRGTDLRNQLMVNQMVIAELADGVLIFNSSGRVRVMNRAAHNILGTQPTDPQFQPAVSTLTGFLPSGPGWEMVSEQLRLWQASGRPPNYQIEVAIQPDLTAERVNRHTRARLRFLQSGTDSGDVVLVIEDLARVEQQAQQLKLASMGRLSASIAHEIRNPLGAIRHASSLLSESQLASQATSARLLRIIEDNSVRINRIIEDILAIARRERSQPEEVDLALFLANFLPEFCESQRTPPGVIAVDIQASQPIRFDPAHLQQVIVNLLGNALRYASGRPGSIRVVWQPAKQGGALDLLVLDDGPGVPSQILPNLFEPFATTESKGTGLGLFLARELCEMNGASLRYEPAAEPQSAASGGFIISVPIAG